MLSFANRQEYVVRLFKSGAGLKLLSACCQSERLREMRPAHSARLCQALVLAGYPAQQADVESAELFYVRDGRQLRAQLRSDA